MRVKYILVVMVLVLVLGSSISEAQQQWLPGMIYKGYVLCEDGLGRSARNLSAPGIPWSEVISGGMSRSAATTTPAINPAPLNPVRMDSVPGENVLSASIKEEGAWDRFVRWQYEGKPPQMEGYGYRHCGFRSGTSRCVP